MMATATVQLSENNIKKTILWFWKSNYNPFDEKDKEEWTRYSDFENDFIEEAFQRNDKEIQVNDVTIDFETKIQFKEGARHANSVKREVIDPRLCVRGERFSFTHRAVKSFERNSTGGNLIHEWYYRNQQIKRLDMDYLAVSELAAQGIIKKGKLLNKEIDAERMAEQLCSCKSEAELHECAVRIYTAESFLYKLINMTMRYSAHHIDRGILHNITMRNEYYGEVDTLGPFCYLLLIHLMNTEEETCPQKLYRGMTLTDEMIEEYKNAIGTEIYWPAFTSTTKDPRVAEFFSGNTLFIITAASDSNLADISSLSRYPDEQEVLIIPQQSFEVTGVSYNDSSGKYLIDLQQ